MTGDIELHGWCATFCQEAVSGEMPDNGADPDDHGHWCRSMSVSGDGITPSGTHFILFAEAMREYVHGVLPASQIDLHNRLRRVVGITLDSNSEPSVLLTPGEAREFAAGLVYLANVVSNIDAPAQRVIR
ncbi:hypothetical protein [Williamsia sterculiae]|uniref:Uncharacterized protein n=1 Tax=Williamsia sterculiae TaxID=1344003 RepID=A0A1N7FDS5_9NOCA|nr:hypothetical protein [Williamsia sterculiae]SIR98509.1 hypothetical protein SAMN05445060_1973 [Williamsia sterculiae]